MEGGTLKKLALLLAFPALLIGCSEDSKPKPKPKDELRQTGEVSIQAAAIQVSDEAGSPLAGAKVLIGSAAGVPFANNFLTADAQGQVAIPADWVDAQPVTVQAAGYVRMTHLARQPGPLTFKLHKTNAPPKYELNGVTNNHPIVERDGNLDVGLVMSALTRNDVMAFDINKVISSDIDKMSVLGQEIEIPSNITIPKQKESYVLPVTLEKPRYRLYFSEKKIQRVFAAQARFPFKTVVDEMRAKKKLYELVNYFTISSGVVRDVNLNADKMTLDLPINELAFKTARTMKAPAVRGDEIMLALAVADLNGYMVPTDVKRLQANESKNLMVLGSSPSLALGVLKKEAEFDPSSPDADRLSAVLLPFNGTVTPQFINLINNPRLASNGDLLLSKPAPVTGVNRLATLTILSDVREVQVGAGTAKFPVRLWEVYAPDWVDTMALPKWPDASPVPKKKRWEVAYIGSQLKQEAELGQAVVDAATHFTHSSSDF